MRRHVRLELTAAEARELDYLAGDLFGDQRELRARIGARRFYAACRAMVKLQEAIYGAQPAKRRPR